MSRDEFINELERVLVDCNQLHERARGEVFGSSKETALLGFIQLAADALENAADLAQP